MFFVVILSLLSFPTKFTLGMGQNNFIALVLLLFSYLLYKEKKLQDAGILLGLAISLKTIFVYFLLFYILKKQWKVIAYAFLILLLSTLLIYLIRGNLDLYKFYLTDLLPPLFRFENREIYTNQGLSGFISRLFTDIYIRKLLTSAISITLVLYNTFIVLKNKKIDLVFSLTIITLLLIDSLAWQHHFVWLLFPFIVLVKYSKNILIALKSFVS
jgi:alpha-1,2-mannosyltransferase